MAFSPMSNVKTIREYDGEIERLKEEIFELKTQLANNTYNHGNSSNIPKILYESSNKVDELTRKIEMRNNQVNELEGDVIRYKEEIDALKGINSHQSGLIEEYKTKMNDMEIFHRENTALLEDENKRLMNRLNKQQNNESQLKSIIVSLESTIKDGSESSFNLNEELQNLKMEKSMIQGKMQQIEGEINRLISENGELRNRLIDMQNESHNSEGSMRNQLVDLKENNRALTSQLERKGATVEELQAKIKTTSSQLTTYSNGMVKFKSALMKQLGAINDKIQVAEGEMKKLKEKFEMTEETRGFLIKNNIDPATSVNTWITKIKSSIRQLKSTTSGPAVNMGNLKERIGEAMKELEICRDYMTKKAKENKELKNTNAKLEGERRKMEKELEKKQYNSIRI